jgi:hypothetical protein
MSDSMPRIALVASIALHAALGVWVEVRGRTTVAPLREVADAWAGVGIEVDAALTLPTGLAVAASESASVEPSSTATDTPTATEPASSQPTGPAPAKRRATHTRAVALRAHRTAPSPASASSAAVAREGAPGSSGPAFGAAGLPVGVRHLPKAFTRALGIASRGDQRWLSLPLGVVGEARIELPVDEEGRLGELEIPNRSESERLAPVVRHLLENTRLLLASGRFSLDPTKVNAGVQRLRVRVELSERVAAENPNADPEHEYEAPAPGRPGHGSFTLEGGRRVTTWVFIDANR